jgi:adenylosuccinate synthase
MKHSCLVNGYDSLNLTKLDVLDNLPEVKVGTKYLVKGEEVIGFPGEQNNFYEESLLTPVSQS